MRTRWAWDWASRRSQASVEVEPTVNALSRSGSTEELATHLSDSELRETQRLLPRRLSFSVAERTRLIAALDQIQEHVTRGHRGLDAELPPKLRAAYGELCSAAQEKKLGFRELVSLIQVSRLRLQQRDPARSQRIRVLRGLGSRQVSFSAVQREALAELASQVAHAEDGAQRAEAERRLSWLAAPRGLTAVQLLALVEESFELPLRGLEG